MTYVLYINVSCEIYQAGKLEKTDNFSLEQLFCSKEYTMKGNEVVFFLLNFRLYIEI